jgi:hypothetical protein
MDSAKRCREQSAECLCLMREAKSETEKRLLRSISQSWFRIANQVERYQSLRLTEHDPVNTRTADGAAGACRPSWSHEVDTAARDHRADK